MGEKLEHFIIPKNETIIKKNGLRKNKNKWQGEGFVKYDVQLFLKQYSFFHLFQIKGKEKIIKSIHLRQLTRKHYISETYMSVFSLNAYLL